MIRVRYIGNRKPRSAGFLSVEMNVLDAHEAVVIGEAIAVYLQSMVFVELGNGDCIEIQYPLGETKLDLRGKTVETPPWEE